MSERSTTAKGRSTKVKEKTVLGLQAMTIIPHGTESLLEIVTPLGRRRSFKTNFIGFDDQKHIFFTVPLLPKVDYDDFFMEGFRVDVEAVSDQSEGALVRFNTSIAHVIYRPVNILVCTVPQKAKLVLLRQETRYELNLLAHLQFFHRKLPVVLNDVSFSGCRLSYDVISPEFGIGHNLLIEIINSSTDETYILSGSVKNGKKQRGKQSYGVVFDDQGKTNCRRLLSSLIYDGVKFVYRDKTDQIFFK